MSTMLRQALHFTQTKIKRILIYVLPELNFVYLLAAAVRIIKLNSWLQRRSHITFYMSKYVKL